MLMRTDPFRELDRLADQAFGARHRSGTMPMDAFRQGDRFVVQIDVPGVDPSSIDLTIEKDVLTVSAERTASLGDGAQVLASERPQGTFRRQLFVGEALDVEHVEASYDHGVLTVTIPVAEQAKPRKVEITANGHQPKALETSAAA